MDFLLAMLYGIIEGITEWLPVSSTGHLILLEKFLPMNVSQEFWDLFLVIIQLGAILAVIVLFFNKLFPFKIKEKFKPDKDIFIMWFKILVACLPCILVVLLKLDEKAEEIFYNPLSVSIALIVVGIIFIIIESINKKTTIEDIKELTFKHAIIIGLFQVIAAIFPGVSRSGITIIGALLLGVSRKTAAEFTFFLAIPAMLGASLLKLVKIGLNFTNNEFIILGIGTLIAFITSIIVIKFLMSYIKKHNFKVFGFYRIILGIIIILTLFI